MFRSKGLISYGEEVASDDSVDKVGDVFECHCLA